MYAEPSHPGNPHTLVVIIFGFVDVVQHAQPPVVLQDVAGAIDGEVVCCDDIIDAVVEVKFYVLPEDIFLVSNEERHPNFHDRTAAPFEGTVPGLDDFFVRRSTYGAPG